MVKENEVRRMTEQQFLASYDPDKYRRPSVTVDMLIFTVRDGIRRNWRRLPEKTLQLLLVKRGRHPFMGMWALPGGFVQVEESLEDAAIRELREETGVSDVYLEQLYTWGDVNRDPRTRVISTSWLALADSSQLELHADDDAVDAAWFAVKCVPMQQGEKTSDASKMATAASLRSGAETDSDSDTVSDTESGVKTDADNKNPMSFSRAGYRCSDFLLTLTNGPLVLEATVRLTETLSGNIIRSTWEVLSSEGIAFDHAKIITCGIERLRSKIQYTDIAFHLMPEAFTLTALQQVYEVLLGKELLKANFRRKTAGMVAETGRTTKDAGHRPSMLYRFNPDWRIDAKREEES